MSDISQEAYLNNDRKIPTLILTNSFLFFFFFNKTESYYCKYFYCCVPFFKRDAVKNHFQYFRPKNQYYIMASFA